MYFYAIHKGAPCGHAHRDTGAELAKCWRGRGHVMRVDVTGTHIRLQGAQLEALRPFVPRPTRGRPPTGLPRQAYATPLYARLTEDQRTRFEALAASRGIDLGALAVALLEQASLDRAINAVANAQKNGTPLGSEGQAHLDAISGYVGGMKR